MGLEKNKLALIDFFQIASYFFFALALALLLIVIAENVTVTVTVTLLFINNFQRDFITKF